MCSYILVVNSLFVRADDEQSFLNLAIHTIIGRRQGGSSTQLMAQAYAVVFGQ